MRSGLAFGRDVAQAPGVSRVLHIPGADDREHHRSTAAQRVASLAARSELFFFNYEYRKALPLPEWMAPPEPLPRFEAGVLPERKYQAFRHDLLVASFHPLHRAKWTAHELCHLLVGFAYRPDASPGFHALGAWLAELLPVALYYFFDEIDLRRCARHEGGGPLYRQFCGDCEQAALNGPRPHPHVHFEREGRAFIDRELAAVERARKSGEIVGTRFGSIDLASDAIAYAAAHRRRLESESFERFTSEFFSEGAGLHADLDSLIERLLEVMEGIVSGAPVRPLGASRMERIAQDLGYRLLLILDETEGDAGVELDRMIDRLAKGRDDAAIRSVEEAYEALAEEYFLPGADEVFAVGYALPGGGGFALDQIREGLESAVPNALLTLGDEADRWIRAFAHHAPPERSPLARRFARFLESASLEEAEVAAKTAGGPPADAVLERAAAHARFEAAIVHSQVAPPEVELRAGLISPRDRYVLAAGVELVRSSFALEEDSEPSDVPEAERAYLIRRLASGEVEITAIDPELALALEGDGALSLGHVPAELFEAGYLVAEALGPID